PEALWARRARGARMAAARAAVVVLPFVAETSAEPRGRRAASRSTAEGSSFHRSFPGRVVPPPAPASRERPPTARAARISAPRGIGGRTKGERTPGLRSSLVRVKSPPPTAFGGG